MEESFVGARFAFLLKCLFLCNANTLKLNCKIVFSNLSKILFGFRDKENYLFGYQVCELRSISAKVGIVNRIKYF